MYMRKKLFFVYSYSGCNRVKVQAQNSRIVEEGGSGSYKAIMMEEPTLTTHPFSVRRIE